MSRVKSLPGLPLEIRLMIWKELSKLPRVIDIRVQYTTDGRPSNGRVFQFRFRSSAGIPPILQVTRDARGVALKYYSPAFSTKCIVSQDIPGTYTESPPSAYVNWAVDILCPIEPVNSKYGGWLLSVSIADTDPPPEPPLHSYLGDVKRLAINSALVKHRLGWLWNLMADQRLEEIIVYTNNAYSQQTRSLAQPYNLDSSVTVWVEGVDSESMPENALNKLYGEFPNTTDIKLAFSRICSEVRSFEQSAQKWKNYPTEYNTITIESSMTDEGKLRRRRHFNGWVRPVIKLVLQPPPPQETTETRPSKNQRQRRQDSRLAQRNEGLGNGGS